MPQLPPSGFDRLLVYREKEKKKEKDTPNGVKQMPCWLFSPLLDLTDNWDQIVTVSLYIQGYKYVTKLEAQYFIENW